MADPQDPFALSIRGVTDLVENKTNKVDQDGGVGPEGIESEKYGALSLKMDDASLLKLRNEWEMRYATYETRMKVIFARNLESYTGKRPDGQWLVDNGPIAANLQFEAEETFLSAALAKNPEPVVWADNTPEGNAIANSVKTMLQFHADQLVLRRKLAIMVRQWSIYHLGVLKHGWDSKINDVSIENRKIQDFVFDPHGYVDPYGDFSSYLGERITITADKLIDLFPDEKSYIELITAGKMGTEVTYTEWWTDEYCFTSFRDRVLDKHKNEYFKYPEPALDPLGQPIMGEDGDPVLTSPKNHFAHPKKPYTFLSVYSLQEQPHDITGLIEQNISNQRIIQERTEQISYNAAASNNSYAFSEDNFNQETAKQAATARKKGNPILIPSGGPIDKAIMPLDAQPLPAFIAEGLQTTKNDLRSSWGIQGIAAQPPNEEQTARGMILNQSHDTTRIGGGIGDAVGQVADNVFNWLTQLYYVFYDERHFAAIMGNSKAVEYVELSTQDMDRQLIVSVAPDSMKPRDEVSQMNMATQLFGEGAIGPKTLLTQLDFPNPDEAAADGVLYKTDPMAYLQMNWPDLAQQLQASQQQQAQLKATQGAQVAGMSAAAEAANTPPAEGESTGVPPAPASLSQVPLPT